MAGYKFDYEEKVWGGEVLRLSPIHFRALRLKYCLKALENVRGKVLDVGCGVGDFCEAINYYRPDLKLFGIDISEKAISFAKKRVKNVEFKTVNAERLPFKDNYFDGVTCFDLIEHVEFPQKVLFEINRVLKPGGVFHAHIPIENNLLSFEGILIKLGWKGKEIYGGHPQHFTKKEVESMLKKEKFEIIRTSFADHLFHQALELVYFTALSIRGKNAGQTVEGYLGSVKPNLKIKIAKQVKNLFAILSNTESEFFSRFPGIGMHITCFKS